MIRSKRPRTTRGLDAEASDKRHKSDTNCLVSLPPELMDQIFDYLLPYPSELEHSCRFDTCISDLFRSPILQVCRDLRQQGLENIADKCTWISVTAKNRECTSYLRDVVQWDCPVLPPIFRRLLPYQPPSTISFVMGDPSQPQIHTRRLSETNMRIMFPYNYSSLLRFCTGLAYYMSDLDYLSIQVPRAFAGIPSAVLEAQILPALKMSQGLFDTDVKLDETTDLYRESTSVPKLNKARRAPALSMFRHQPGMVYDLLRESHMTLSIADNLEAKGFHDQSALWLCYRGLTLRRIMNHFLPPTREWELGENDPAGDASAYDPRGAARNPVGNELRTAFHRVEYRACLGFWSLFKRHGKKFIESHYSFVTCGGTRWWDESGYPWFGLSQEELAEVHHAKALTRQIKIEAFSRRPGVFDADEDYLPDPEFDGAERYDIEIPLEEDQRVAAVANAAIACVLQPRNRVYRELYDLLTDVPPDYFRETYNVMVMDQIRRDPSALVSEHLIPGAQVGVPSAVWKGDREMMHEWGGWNTVVNLSLAQKKLGDQELRRILQQKG